MVKNKYTDATNERKWNYIFLLHTRYKGSFSRLARAMGIPQAELKNWDVEFKNDVMQWIENEKKLCSLLPVSGTSANGTDAVIEELPPIPKPEELIEQIMRRLNTTIVTETDPSKLSRTLEHLHQLQANKAAGGNNTKCSTITQAVEEKLKKSNKNE